MRSSCASVLAGETATPTGTPPRRAGRYLLGIAAIYTGRSQSNLHKSCQRHRITVKQGKGGQGMSTSYTFEGGILTVRTGRDPASGEVIATTRRALDELHLGSESLVILDASEMRSGRSSEELRDLAASLQDERLGAVALVAVTEHHYGMARVIQVRAEEHVAIQVFRNLEEAGEWLHLMGRQETGQS
jgi:hypothetical protein